jgi:hypothetical protein
MSHIYYTLLLTQSCINNTLCIFNTKLLTFLIYHGEELVLS